MKTTSRPHSKKQETFVLDAVLLESAKALVDQGDYRSLNDLAELAISDLVNQHQKKQIREDLIEASRDVLFLEDIAEVQRDFQDADQESLGEIS